MMSTSFLKALPGKLDIKRHSPSILYLYATFDMKNMAPFHYWFGYMNGLCYPVPEVVERLTQLTLI